MAIKLGQSLKQTQNLMMTPQLQQAIKLLTLTHLEMTNVIAEEMVENPMLEEVDGSDKNEADYKLEGLETRNKEATSDDFKEEGPVNKDNDDFDWDKYIDSYNNHSSSMPQSMTGPASQDDIPNYENIVSRGATLAEHLEWQLRMEDLSEDDWKVAHILIHEINEEGYLEIEINDVVEKADSDEERVLEILKMIQALDPVGCGARTLSECLLAQAEKLDPRMPLVETIVDRFLEQVEKGNYADIAKAIGIDEEKIRDTEYIVKSLNPKPGRLISPEAVEYVIPDIYVKDVGGELQIELNDEGVPRLKVSKLYQQMLKANGDKNTQDYVQDKLRSALWLIKSIQNRQNTIHKVAEAILRYQPDFFKKGAAFLRPMILKDIAGEIGVHESTVSRVTTNKYMHTPLGVFELKYFFNSGIGGKNGGIDIASESLKLKLKELVDNENPAKPLSDQKIVELLKTQDIVVARRTVAKYREMMNIQSSSKRKKRK